MFFAHIIFILIIAAGTLPGATGQLRCRGKQNYNKEENDCCFTCPKGYVTHSACVKDINKECATCPEPNNFINWLQNGPKCETCRKCKRESSLVEIQSCSLLTEAICQCKAGFYCHTAVPNSCARCNPYKHCPRGQGVKQKGSPEKDTECEACPSGTYSNVTSDTEPCRPHTDCNKLNRMTTRSGSATEDALCGGPIDQGLISSQNFTYKTYTRSQASSDTTTLYTMTSGTITSTTDEGANESDESSLVVILAVIICVISLLIAFFLAWKQKMCNLKLWKYFIHPGASGVPQKTVIPSMTENMEDLLKKGNDGPLEDQHLIQPGRDQMNNRIEKIYIMNADTVLVGSVSEVPTCWRSVTTECDSQDRGPLESHYPVQESSKLSANDLMISIEEEERESCAAKALLEV